MSSLITPAMGKALQDAGYDPAEAEFLTAFAKYLNNGGTVERAKVLLAEAAERMPQGGGHVINGTQMALAPTERQQDSGGGGQRDLDAQSTYAASPATERDDAGHEKRDAHPQPAPSSQPDREGAGHQERDTHITAARPSRGLAAMAATNNQLYADFRIGTLGMKFGDVRIPSLDRMIFVAGREKVMARLAKAYVSRQAHLPAPDAMLREVVPDEVFGQMIAFAKHASMHGIEFLNDTALLEQMEAFDG